MGRTRCRVLLGACLAALAAASSAPAQEAEQYALLAPRRPSAATESPPPTTSASDAMTLQQPAPEPPPPEVPYEPAPEIQIAPKGYTGPSPFGRSLAQDDFLPIPDRWRVGFPTGYRPETGGYGHIYDPYNQNVLKGDYPFWGNDKFLMITATSDTLLETRRLP